jgi:hypothetical protein
MGTCSPLARLPAPLGSTCHHPRTAIASHSQGSCGHAQGSRRRSAEPQAEKSAGKWYNCGADVHISPRPWGNSAAALRRLERYRPDILDRVLAGEMSAHAGMIEAGFRKRPPRP